MGANDPLRYGGENTSDEQFRNTQLCDGWQTCHCVFRARRNSLLRPERKEDLVEGPRQLSRFVGHSRLTRHCEQQGDSDCDATGPSSLVALDIETGDELWRTKREDKPRGGWSTPIMVDAGKRNELILNGEFGVRGYDPESGKELWFCKSFNGRGSPVPEFANGLVFVVSGKPGDIYAVSPGGSGDVTKTRMKWHSQRRGGRDLPSPAVVGNYIFVLSMSGIGSCYDAQSGELLWNDRVPMKGEFAGAPLVANGLVYFQSVNGGDTVVIKPGKTPQFVAQNSLGADSKEIFRAGLAPIGGRLFARSQSTVYCIKP